MPEMGASSYRLYWLPEQGFFRRRRTSTDKR